MSDTFDLDAVMDFGGIDADSDPLLDQCFENHPAYIEARSHAKTVVLGRKGSGKTAIFSRFLKITDPNTHVMGHVFSDHPWHHHAKQRQAGVPDELCFVNSWEYLIYITLAKILLKQDESQPWSSESVDEMVKLSNFIYDTYGSLEPSLSQIFSPNLTIKMKGEIGVNFKVVQGKIAGDIVPMEYLPVLVSEINQNFNRAIMKCANPEKHYFICFDELDLGFSLEKMEYHNQLTGLLIAARKINSAARNCGKNISIIIFLRDDIYQMLHFEDKNKITGTWVSAIEWDVDKSTPSLKSVMEKRFHHTLGIPEAGAWDEVFDEKQQMTGRQTKYNHILDRTFLRPRDIIRFTNEILRAYKSPSGKSTWDCIAFAA